MPQQHHQRITTAALSERMSGWEKLSAQVQQSTERSLSDVLNTVRSIHEDMATSEQVKALKAQVDKIEAKVEGHEKTVNEVPGLKASVDGLERDMAELKLDRAHGRGWLAGAIAVGGLVGGVAGWVLSMVSK